MVETRVSLLERVRDRNNAGAWSEFVAIYEPLLMAYIRKRGVIGHDAADVVQDVFVRLIPALARFELDAERGRFRTWLWQVTHSALSDWARRHRVRMQAERMAVAERDPEDEVSPDRDFLDMHRRRVLELVLPRVRATAQETSWACFEQRILKGRPAAQIAQELGVSVNAVYVNASRLLARVKEACTEFSEPLECYEASVSL